jgi:hypothetical protein
MKSKIWIWIGILIVIIAIIKFYDSKGPSSQQRPTDSSQVDSTITTSGTGLYLNYRYVYQTSGNRTAVSFKPMLPRDDAIVIGAMIEVLKVVYGKHIVVNLIPSLVEKRGTNVIRFEGTEVDYFFLLVKENTGEVNSFSMWTEAK